MTNERRDLPGCFVEEDRAYRRELCLKLAADFLRYTTFAFRGDPKKFLLATAGESFLDIPDAEVKDSLSIGMKKAGLGEVYNDDFSHAVTLSRFYWQNDVRLPDRIIYVHDGRCDDDKEHPLVEVVKTIKEGEKILICLDGLDAFSRRKEFFLEIPQARTDYHGFFRGRSQVAVTPPDLFVRSLLRGVNLPPLVSLDVTGIENLIIGGKINSNGGVKSTFKGEGLCVIGPMAGIGGVHSQHVRIEMRDVFQCGGVNANTEIVCCNYVQNGGQVGIRGDGTLWKVGSKILIRGGRYIYKGGEKIDPLIVEITGDPDWEIPHRIDVIDSEHRAVNGSEERIGSLSTEEIFDGLYCPQRVGQRREGGKIFAVRQYTFDVSEAGYVGATSVDNYAKFLFLASTTGWVIDKTEFPGSGHSKIIVVLLTREVNSVSSE